ncbi:MAG: 2-dehydro-3-deoxygluconokinase [Burkholderiales bacterium RIFCSPHIGHO2_12_FULL_69_20]|nr:MAG: 2-dehydro-3-deoxygluconokinase [Burkholderiales bacterium RIFCSPHIGHO2_12_FULL_69_20]
MSEPVHTPANTADHAPHFDLIALGEPLIEFNQRDPAAPAFTRGFGGDTSNAAIAAARLGARVAFVGQVGDDTFGRDLLALWQAEGVATEGVRTLAGTDTGLYFVSHGAAGHEFSYRRAGSAAARMTPADLPRALLARTRWLHVSGISLAISTSACDAVLAAIALARSAGAKISFDLNYRARLWPPARALALTRQVLADCDLFLPGLDEIQTLSGLDDADAALAWAHAQGARAVVLKLGPTGCRISDGAQRLTLPGHAVAAVDATGAGDCFAGACLSQLARGATLADAARLANVAAALSTRGFGAVAPLPRPADLAAAGWPVR